MSEMRTTSWNPISKAANARSPYVLDATREVSRLLLGFALRRATGSPLRGGGAHGNAIDLALGRRLGRAGDNRSRGQGAVPRRPQPLVVDPQRHSHRWLVRTLGVRLCALAEDGCYERQFVAAAKICGVCCTANGRWRPGCRNPESRGAYLRSSHKAASLRVRALRAPPVGRSTTPSRGRRAGLRNRAGEGAGGSVRRRAGRARSSRPGGSR